MSVARHAPDAPFVDPLGALERVAVALAADDISGEARATAARVHEGRFFVACLGQFKRGKSTLLNALVEAAVLPVGVTPVTAVVTVLRHGRAIEARVRIGDEPWRRVETSELSAYVSEIENPENVKNVTGVEVFVPSPLLSSGLCLVDTPGIGSVFAGNTEATRAFVPHIDAALVVLGADPPISGDELRLVETVAKEVRDFVFVLAKADRLRGDEVAQAKAFTEGILKKTVPDARVLEISALERVEGGAHTRDWASLIDSLEALARTRGAELVAVAERRAIARIAATLDREVAERRSALVRPREETERRLASLRSSVKDAERLLLDAGPLFGAIEARLSKELERAREMFMGSARASAEAALTEAVTKLPGGKDAQVQVIEAAQCIAREHVESWRARSAPVAERMYGDAVSDLVAAANGVLRRITESGDAALAGLSATLDIDTRFRAAPHFYFTEMLTLSGRSLRTTLLSTFGGEAGRQRALVQRARPYLSRLLETNSWRATNDFIEQIRESRRKLESDIRSLLRGVTSSVERALDEASAARAKGEQGIADALARLDEASAAIRKIAGPDDGR